MRGISGLPGFTNLGQTDLIVNPPPLLSGAHPPPNIPPHNNRLPDLLNSHVPPPYSTLPGGATVPGPGPPRVIGASAGPHPRPVALPMPPPPPPANGPIMPGITPPAPGTRVHPVPIESSWTGFFGSRR